MHGGLRAASFLWGERDKTSSEGDLEDVEPDGAEADGPLVGAVVGGLAQRRLAFEVRLWQGAP